MVGVSFPVGVTLYTQHLPSDVPYSHQIPCRVPPRPYETRPSGFAAINGLLAWKALKWDDLARIKSNMASRSRSGRPAKFAIPCNSSRSTKVANSSRSTSANLGVIIKSSILRARAITAESPTASSGPKTTEPSREETSVARPMASRNAASVDVASLDSRIVFPDDLGLIRFMWFSSPTVLRQISPSAFPAAARVCPCAPRQRLLQAVSPRRRPTRLVPSRPPSIPSGRSCVRPSSVLLQGTH